MKHLILLLFFLLIGESFIQAQDLIVKSNGDSLNCKIIYIESESIHFSYKDTAGIVRVSLLPVSQVKYKKKNFFPKSEVSPDKIRIAENRKLRFGFYGGWSYITAKVGDNVPAAFDEYMQQLKSGYHFGADFNYFISENIGFGIKYTIFRTQNEVESIYAIDTTTGKTYYGRLEDDITCQFIAPTFTTRVSSDDKKINFIADAALGYLHYKDNATLINSFTLTGGTLGLLLDAGVDFHLVNDLSLGFCFSYLMGSLTQYKYYDGVQKKTIEFEEGTVEGLSRFDASVGLHWNF
jgi:hypothetical protein